MRLYFIIARRRYDALSPIAMLTIDLIDVLFIIPAVVYGSSYLWLAVAVQYISRRWSFLAKGFLLTWGIRPTPFWCKVFPGAVRYADSVMSGDGEDLEDEESAPNPPILPATTTPATPANVIAIDDNERNALLFAAKADALAAMVHAGKVGETEGIKMVYGVGPSSTNKTYLAAREMLKARLARLAPEKYNLTPEQKTLRAQLGLSDGKGSG